jgi:pseudaminic acid cytidylyltransferase
VIPARGGSKRIPRKNIKDFKGKPMIAYAIEAAKESHLFSRIIVSTDDLEVSEISQRYGAEIPFLRPAELADDHTPTVPVVAHAIHELESRGDRYDYVCCLYPCVPFLEGKDLINGLLLLKQGSTDYCFSVGEYYSPIQRALKMSKDGRLSPFFPEFELSRTQDLERAYHDAGQFYWGKKHAWLTNPHIHKTGVGFPVPWLKASDIDTSEDWARAELMFKCFDLFSKENI